MKGHHHGSCRSEGHRFVTGLQQYCICAHDQLKELLFCPKIHAPIERMSVLSTRFLHLINIAGQKQFVNTERGLVKPELHERFDAF